MSERTKIGIVVAVLLALVPLWNLVAEGAAKVFRPKKPQVQKAEGPPKVKLPLKKGPADAPVVVTAFVAGNNPCHTSSIQTLAKLADEYSGQVRVEVYDQTDPEIKKKADAEKIGCEMGILVNGRGAFNIPGRGIVTFHGPLDASENYNLQDLRFVIERTIRKKTGKPPKHKTSEQTPSGDCAGSHASSCGDH